MNTIRAHKIQVVGRVQGVFFRKYTQDKAKELGICGFVMNLSDGSVYCEAEGNEKEMESFVSWLHTGSPHSRVDEVNIEKTSPSNFTTFEIRRNL